MSTILNDILTQSNNLHKHFESHKNVHKFYCFILSFNIFQILKQPRHFMSGLCNTTKINVSEKKMKKKCASIRNWQLKWGLANLFSILKKKNTISGSHNNCRPFPIQLQQWVKSAITFISITLFWCPNDLIRYELQHCLKNSPD